jgi:hypothetical protein
MPAPPKWGTTPRESVESAEQRLGRGHVVDGCIALLRGRRADPELTLALGGRPARWAAGYDEPAGPEYWLRVWGARGLLYAWDDAAAPAVIEALHDDAWRVREMALRVIARHRITAALPAVIATKDDASARVRAAARRTEARLR